MKTWIIEPRDTLVLRDGRPSSGGGEQMTGIPIPYPQATAGLLRTRSSVDADGAFVFPDPDPDRAKKEAHIAALKATKTYGPWLGLLDESGQVEEQVLPAPRDAVLFGTEEESYFLRLGLREGGSFKEGKSSDLGERATEVCFLSEESKDKPLSAPPLWSWSKLQKWLEAPQDKTEILPKKKQGIDLPNPVTRTGTQIKKETQGVEDGQLFSIEHREFFFSSDQSSRKQLSSSQKLCLLVQSEAENVKAGAIPFAGKRRTVFLREANVAPPSAPCGLLKTIAEAGKARVILLTPAFFEEGWKPKGFLQSSGRVDVTLKSAIVPRPQTVSGWDFDRRKPKPTRRLVSAGAVFFIEFSGTKDDKIEWLQEHWWTPISDTEQARNDGYGLAVFGVDHTVTVKDECNGA